MITCDDCKKPKTPIIYIRSSRKLCRDCCDVESTKTKKIINKMNFIVPWEPLLGYKFISNEWFNDESKGRKYAEWIYDNFGSVSN